MIRLLFLVLSFVCALAQNVAVSAVSGCGDNGAICPTMVASTLTITGTGFLATSNPVVMVGAFPCSNVIVVSSTLLTCVVQGGTSTQGGSIGSVVTVSQGSFISSQNTVKVLFADVYFTSLAGKQPDPCHINIVAGLGTGNCDLATRSRLPGATVYLPSQSSVLFVPPTNLVLNGVNLPPNSGVGLASAADPLNCGSAINTVACSPASPAGTCTFAVPTAWTSLAMELQQAPQYLCFFPGAFAPTSKDAPQQAVVAKWTGFAIGTVWNCDPVITNQLCTNLPFQGAGYELLTLSQQLERQARTVCCKSTTSNGVGVCINPNVQSCCGGSSFQFGVARCCNPATEVAQFNHFACPCTTGVACPLGEMCCMNTKYPELAGVATQGQCFNPISHKCCNTGARYDPGQQQCCAINGLQSTNVPCPCGADADCQLGGRVNFACCMQNAPTPNEAITFPVIGPQPMCSSYQNFPTGTAPYQVQRCPGNCMNTDYQICCNGVPCIKAYEKCCNSTCCNFFTGSCNYAQRAQTPSNQYNWMEFRVTYLQCSRIEHLNELKAFWIFVWPLYLLMMTLGSLALCVVFANKASSRSYSALEQAIIVFAILAIVFSLSLFFSPIYKYGMVVIFAQLLCILTSGVRVRWLNFLTVAALLITIIYIFDPFHGNAYLTLASGRNPDGSIDRETMGIWHITFKMWRNWNETNTQRWCTQYYDYFRFDAQMYDYARFDNPSVTTWGYCDRGWVFALLMFEGLIILFTLINFILVILALFLRFSQPSNKDEEVVYLAEPQY